MTIEGEIIVRLERDERRVRRVTVRSTRPHAASRVVLGKAPQDAMAMVPSLFSICAHAQGAASASAIEAAEGRSASAEARASRETAVVLEMVQEYLWRTLVDWPQAQGQPSELEPVARVRRLMAPVLSQLATRARSPGGDVSTSAGRVPGRHSRVRYRLYGVSSSRRGRLCQRPCGRTSECRRPTQTGLARRGAVGTTGI